ncbi:MAG: flavin reductase family protein [Candidatus Omnitrophota bacterium]
MAGQILDVITSPVTVITAKSGDKINGMTVAWIMQAACNPAYVVVSIAPERFTYSLIKESGLFGVNILSDNQNDIGKRFGFSSGRDSDKFKGIKFHNSRSGLPMLDAVKAYIECKVVNVAKSGDHDLFIGEVIYKEVDDSKRTLVFKSSDYF